nr:MAG TPA: hypothetical protein [Caudoviricetes sp.]
MFFYIFSSRYTQQQSLQQAKIQHLLHCKY